MAFKNIHQIVQSFKINWPQIFAVIISSLSGVVYGLSFAWTSPSILKIIKDNETYNITEDEASYFTIIPYASMLITIIPLALINDLIGRRNTILLMAIPCILSWIINAFCTSLYWFYLSRLLTGLNEILFISMPMYIGEITTPNVRGSWGNCISFSVNFGCFLINVIGSYNSIQNTSFICLGFCILFVISFPLIPESPYFYIIRGKYNEARKTLQWLNNKDNIEEDFQRLKSTVEKELTEKASWKELFLIESNRKALIAALFMDAALPLSGLAAFSAYNQLIFDKSGGSVSPEISSIIVTGFVAVLCIFAGFTIDNVGRKKSFMLSLLACTITLLIETIYFYMEQYHHATIENFRWVPLVGMFLFYFFHTMGIGTISVLILEEIFATNIKTKGLSLCCVAFGTVTALTNELFQVLQSSFGLYGPFLFFTLCCFILTIMSSKLVPETSGKTLEEIQKDFKTNNHENTQL